MEKAKLGAAVFFFCLFSLFAVSYAQDICATPPTVPTYIDISQLRESDQGGRLDLSLYNESIDGAGNMRRIGVQRGLIVVIQKNSGNPSTCDAGAGQLEYCACKLVTDANGNAVKRYAQPAGELRRTTFTFTYCPITTNSTLLSECASIPDPQNAVLKMQLTGAVGQQPWQDADLPYCDGGEGVPSGSITNIPTQAQLAIENEEKPDVAQLCWPLMLILGLLVGAMFASGRNPFAAFDFSSPRMSRGKQYQMRSQSKSFDATSIALAVQRASSIYGMSAKAQVSVDKEGNVSVDGKKVGTAKTENGQLVTDEKGRIVVTAEAKMPKGMLGPGEAKTVMTLDAKSLMKSESGGWTGSKITLGSVLNPTMGAGLGGWLERGTKNLLKSWGSKKTASGYIDRNGNVVERQVDRRGNVVNIQRGAVLMDQGQLFAGEGGKVSVMDGSGRTVMQINESDIKRDGSGGFSFDFKKATFGSVVIGGITAVVGAPGKVSDAMVRKAVEWRAKKIKREQAHVDKDGNVTVDKKIIGTTQLDANGNVKARLDGTVRVQGADGKVQFLDADRFERGGAAANAPGAVGDATARISGSGTELKSPADTYMRPAQAGAGQMGTYVSMAQSPLDAVLQLFGFHFGRTEGEKAVKGYATYKEAWDSPEMQATVSELKGRLLMVAFLAVLGGGGTFGSAGRTAAGTIAGGMYFNNLTFVPFVNEFLRGSRKGLQGASIDDYSKRVAAIEQQLGLEGLKEEDRKKRLKELEESQDAKVKTLLLQHARTAAKVAGLAYEDATEEYGDASRKAGKALSRALKANAAYEEVKEKGTDAQVKAAKEKYDAAYEDWEHANERATVADRAQEYASQMGQRASEMRGLLEIAYSSKHTTENRMRALDGLSIACTVGSATAAAYSINSMVAAIYNEDEFAKKIAQVISRKKTELKVDFKGAGIGTKELLDAFEAAKVDRDALVSLVGAWSVALGSGMNAAYTGYRRSMWDEKKEAGEIFRGMEEALGKFLARKISAGQEDDAKFMSDLGYNCSVISSSLERLYEKKYDTLLTEEERKGILENYSAALATLFLGIGTVAGASTLFNGSGSVAGASASHFGAIYRAIDEKGKNYSGVSGFEENLQSMRKETARLDEINELARSGKEFKFEPPAGAAQMQQVELAQKMLAFAFNFKPVEKVEDAAAEFEKNKAAFLEKLRERIRSAGYTESIDDPVAWLAKNHDAVGKIVIAVGAESSGELGGERERNLELAKGRQGVGREAADAFFRELLAPAISEGVKFEAVAREKDAKVERYDGEDGKKAFNLLVESWKAHGGQEKVDEAVALGVIGIENGEYALKDRKRWESEYVAGTDDGKGTPWSKQGPRWKIAGLDEAFSEHRRMEVQVEVEIKPAPPAPLDIPILKWKMDAFTQYAAVGIANATQLSLSSSKIGKRDVEIAKVYGEEIQGIEDAARERVVEQDRIIENWIKAVEHPTSAKFDGAAFGSYGGSDASDALGASKNMFSAIGNSAFWAASTSNREMESFLNGQPVFAMRQFWSTGQYGGRWDEGLGQFLKLPLSIVSENVRTSGFGDVNSLEVVKESIGEREQQAYPASVVGEVGRPGSKFGEHGFRDAEDIGAVGNFAGSIATRNPEERDRRIVEYLSADEGRRNDMHLQADFENGLGKVGEERIKPLVERFGRLGESERQESIAYARRISDKKSEERLELAEQFLNATNEEDRIGMRFAVATEKESASKRKELEKKFNAMPVEERRQTVEYDDAMAPITGLTPEIAVQMQGKLEEFMAFDPTEKEKKLRDAQQMKDAFRMLREQ